MKREFLGIGENIHCTRIFKVGGVNVKPVGSGHAILYSDNKEKLQLPVPDHFITGADWQAGKVKHCAVAVWHGLYGTSDGRAAAARYLRSMATKQEAAHARFLDVNVDEFSTDVDEKIKALRWVAQVVQEASALPLSIDSSNPAILEAGLAACNPAKGAAMINSVSLERQDAIALASKYKAAVVASAAGEKGLPANTEERMSNIGRLMPLLAKAGIPNSQIYVDPLVFPIGTDSTNAVAFLDAVRRIRTQYGADIHITGGLSNVSFGMPARKLINQVFAWLAVEAGADSGIVDPTQINGAILAALDNNSEPFRLASDLLTGKDDFGMEFITAHREGKLGD